MTERSGVAAASPAGGTPSPVAALPMLGAQSETAWIGCPSRRSTQRRHAPWWPALASAGHPGVRRVYLSTSKANACFPYCLA